MGFTPLSPEDAQDILELISAIEAADGAPLRTSLTEVEEFFDGPMTWRAFGTRDADGRLVSFGMARILHSGGEVRLSGGVHPDVRGMGLGKELAQQQLVAARELGGSSAVVHVDTSNTELAHILTETGFARSHEYVQLRKSVVGFPEFPVPQGISIVALDESKDADVLGFHNMARLQGGAEVTTQDMWAAEHSFIDRNWSFAAYDIHGDRPRLAAYLVVERYEEEWAFLGWSEGYISEVALGEDWRGLNLVSALLTKCVAQVHESGVDYIGIDMQDDDYLLATFIDRGFERTGITEVYTLPLD